MFFWTMTGQPLASRSGAIMHRGPQMPTFSNWLKLMGRNSPRSILASQARFSFRFRLQKADDVQYPLAARQKYLTLSGPVNPEPGKRATCTFEKYSQIR